MRFHRASERAISKYSKSRNLSVSCFYFLSQAVGIYPVRNKHNKGGDCEIYLFKKHTAMQRIFWLDNFPLKFIIYPDIDWYQNYFNYMCVSLSLILHTSYPDHGSCSAR